jgi:hypothetical protein
MFVYYESITQSEGLTEELGWKGITLTVFFFSLFSLQEETMGEFAKQKA